MPAPRRNPPISVTERASRYCVKLDVTQCGSQSCHLKTYHVACVLVQAFALSPGEALPILGEWAARGSHRWSEAELRHKLQCALNERGFQSKGGVLERGCFLARKEQRQRWQRHDDSQMTPEQKEADKAKRAAERAERAKATAFSGEKLAEAAGTWAGVVNLVWLANRSAMDPALVTAQDYLKALYRPGEKVIIMDRYDDGFLWPDETIPETGRDGVKMLANPVSGAYLPNPRGKPDLATGKVPASRRIAECVTAFRFLVLESDKADLKDWLGFLVQAPLRIAAIYTSGGRSIHTLVRLDCRSRTEYEATKTAMAPFLAGVRIFGVDPGPMQPLAPTRLPCCYREGKSTEELLPDGTKRYGFFPFPKGPKLQKLLYLQPSPDGRPLIEMPAVRNVEDTWCELAKFGISDADETGGKGLLNGLSYYANTSPRCLEALRGLRELSAKQ
jgi:hypothetical protein